MVCFELTTGEHAVVIALYGGDVMLFVFDGLVAELCHWGEDDLDLSIFALNEAEDYGWSLPSRLRFGLEEGAVAIDNLPAVESVGEVNLPAAGKVGEINEAEDKPNLNLIRGKNETKQLYNALISAGMLDSEEPSELLLPLGSLGECMAFFVVDSGIVACLFSDVGDIFLLPFFGSFPSGIVLLPDKMPASAANWM